MAREKMTPASWIAELAARFWQPDTAALEMIVILETAGFSDPEIAARIGLAPPVFAAWRARLARAGLMPKPPRPKRR